MARHRHEAETVIAPKRGVPGLSFSLSRAFGLSKIKRDASRNVGVPLNRAGRQRKAGAAVGCCVVLTAPLAGLGLTPFALTEMFR